MAAREAYFPYVERAAEGANEADGPFSASRVEGLAGSDQRRGIRVNTDGLGFADELCACLPLEGRLVGPSIRPGQRGERL